MSARLGRPRRWLRLIAAARARKRILMRVLRPWRGGAPWLSEGEQVFAGLEDRLDPLPDGCEVRSAAGLVFAAWPHDRCVEVGGGLLELAAGVAFIADDEQVPGAVAALQQGEADIAFGGLGRGQHQGAWGAIEREEAVQAEAPEVAAVACAVAVVGRVGELAAPGCLDAA